jgi:large conductance mechanosensitive channel
MGMIQEFRDFAIKGNVVDMAVGIVIGGAFTNIVGSLVKDVITPPLALLQTVPGVKFQNMVIPLREAVGDTPPVGIEIGSFINSIISFLIVAFVMFLVVKQMNRLKKPAPAATPTTKECPQCLSTIPLKAKRCAHCTAQLES